MFRFLMNLFNIGKKKADGKEHFWEGETEVIVDKSNRELIVKTKRRLTEDEIIGYFQKYILGED